MSCCAETGYVELLVVNLVIAHVQSSGLNRIEFVNTINNMNSPYSSKLQTSNKQCFSVNGQIS
jgi:hypothetical protein